MGQALYVKRDTYPSVLPGDEVMMIARDKGSESAVARFYVVALNPGTTFETRSGQGADVSAFDVSAGPGTMGRGERFMVELPVTAAADHNVYVMRCLTGRLAVTLVSPHTAQMQFRSRGRVSA